jgi:hypothetical protein
MIFATSEAFMTEVIDRVERALKKLDQVPRSRKL